MSEHIKVTYGDIDHNLTAGQTITFSCAGKVMRSDIEIVCGEYTLMSIRYGETVKEGTSATIECNGKKLMHDIVVTAIDNSPSSNFTLSDGSVLFLSDGKIFIAKES